MRPQQVGFSLGEATPATEETLPLGEVLQLLRHAVSPKAEVASLTVYKQRRDYCVLLVRLRNPDMSVVVKLAGPKAQLPCPFGRTAAVHRLVSDQTDIPMPAVLAVDTSYRLWPWRIFIKVHTPGVEWAELRHRLDTAELHDANAQFGHAVAQLHRIRFPAFGELDDDGCIGGSQPLLAALRERAARFIGSLRLLDLFLLALERRRDLFECVREASLCHEDLHEHNLLFQWQEDRWRLATILDFDKAWAGHSESDLARLDLWTGMSSQAFAFAYQAMLPIDTRYPQRRPIYQLLWCLEYARPTARHLADTQRVCAELGLSFEGFD